MIETSPPGLPFMAGIWRNIANSVQAGCLELLGVVLDDIRIFTGAAAFKNQFHLFVKRLCIGHYSMMRRGRIPDCASAEDADMGKHIQISHGNNIGLHAAHRQTGHSPVRLSGQGAVFCINHWNHLFQKHLFKGVCPTLRRPGLSALPSGGRPASRHGPGAVVHHNEKRNSPTFCEQIVHNQIDLTLIGPAGFIFSAAVLEIENRIAAREIFVVVRRGINKTPPPGLHNPGKVKMLTNMAVRNIFECIKILIAGRYLNTAAPSSGPIEKEAAWVRNLRPVNDKLIIMEPFILGRRNTRPNPLFILRHRIFDASNVQKDALGLRCCYSGQDPPF